MNNTILKLLSAAALVAAMAAPAFADTVHGSDVDVTVSGFTPVSSTGNSFTFSGGSYVGDGFPNSMLYKTLFIVDAHAGKALTGKMSFTMDVQYQFAAPPAPQPAGDYFAYASGSVDVLAPRCDRCGPFDSDLLGNVRGSGNATATTPTSGTISFVSAASDATGRYDNLLAYLFYGLTLDPAYGSMSITSLTMSFDTVTAASPVPELPPLAMMGAGLAALGLCARVKGRKKPAKVALEA
ncbi:hypothetical protein JOD97_001047 [Duganella sp. 1411]|uniref:hypothetical protein n=1 Tax=Duganella sp. 1411 TaxID=2806572 RepID=UPI001AE56F6A|nr:hypothetical protein [Duganella sp. 1411]MBP1203033.1 hypothetical protein [Duganella sp. 1411]